MSILVEDEIIDVNLSHMDVRFGGISNEGVVRGLIDVIKNDLSEAYDCDWTIHLLEIIIRDVASKINGSSSPSFRIDGNYIGGTKCDVVLHGYMTMCFSIIFNYSLPKDIKNPDTRVSGFMRDSTTILQRILIDMICQVLLRYLGR